MKENIHTQFIGYVGVDWADQKHDYCLKARGSQEIHSGEFEQSPEAIALWIGQLRQRLGKGTIAICLEQSRGALIYGLNKYEDIVLFPINPQTLTKFLQAFYPGRAKDDPLDARLALDVLCHHRDKLRAWNPDTAQTRQLALLCEARRKTVELRTELTRTTFEKIRTETLGTLTP